MEKRAVTMKCVVVTDFIMRSNEPSATREAKAKKELRRVLGELDIYVEGTIDYAEVRTPKL